MTHRFFSLPCGPDPDWCNGSSTGKGLPSTGSPADAKLSGNRNRSEGSGWLDIAPSASPCRGEIAATGQGPRCVARVSSGRISLGQAAMKVYRGWRGRDARSCGGFHTDFVLRNQVRELSQNHLNATALGSGRCRCYFKRNPGARRWGCGTTSAPRNQ
jgi:hypothetical protein